MTKWTRNRFGFEVAWDESLKRFNKACEESAKKKSQPAKTGDTIRREVTLADILNNREQYKALLDNGSYFYFELDEQDEEGKWHTVTYIVKYVDVCCGECTIYLRNSFGEALDPISLDQFKNMVKGKLFRLFEEHVIA